MTKAKAQRRKHVVLPQNEKSKPKAAKTPSSLMDKADDEELDQRRPKRQRLRCLDAAVSKAIADKLQGYGRARDRLDIDRREVDA